MRTIKFRAWDKDTGVMLEAIEMSWTKSGISIRCKGGDYRHIKTLKNIELMQFTGLLDKNEKEIYEGDIYRTPITPKAIVEYRRDGFYLENEKLIEVIGNIYENPELTQAA